jgi:predicted  nucleic acid-binding Zn-ribbon protein
MAEENIIIFKTQIEGLESIDELNKQLSEAKKTYKAAQAGSEDYIKAQEAIVGINSKLDAHKQFLKQVDNQSKANTNTIEGLRNKYKELALASI